MTSAIITNIENAVATIRNLASGLINIHLLWHVHNDDEKLIGVYATNADAVAAKERLRHKPGFVDAPEGFEIHEYQLNQDHWTEGYVCV